MSNVIEVENIGELQDLIATEPHLVVKYWATWCGPCAMFKRTYEMAADKVDATFVAVDIDKVPEVSVEYGVLSVPQVHHYRAGTVENQLIGAQRLIPFIDILNS